MDDAIFDRYKSDDAYVFKNVQQLIEDEDKLNRTYEHLSKRLKKKKYKRDDSYIRFRNDEWSTIKGMLEDGIIFWDKERLTINQAMKDTLDKFVVFLIEKDEDFKKTYRHDLKDEESNEDIESEEEEDDEFIENK